MIVTQAGQYKALENITLHSDRGNSTILQGSVFTVSRVDIELGVILGPTFPGWQPANMPVSLEATPETLKAFFDKWAEETAPQLPLIAFPPDYAERCTAYFCEYFGI